MKTITGKTITGLAIAGFLLVGGTAGAQQPGAVIAEFSGTAPLTTGLIEVPATWYLQWSAPGALGQAYINIETPDGRRLEGVSGNSGSRLEPYPGPIRLTIASPNPWSVRVLRADP